MSCWALCTLLLAQAGAVPVEEVRVVTFTLAPYVLDINGVTRGALVEFFDEEIAPRMGVRFRWQQPMTVARLLRSLGDGSADMAPILSRAGDRLALVDYSERAHIRFEPMLAVRADSPLRQIDRLEQLDGLRIGWVTQGVIESVLRRPQIAWDLIGEVHWERSNLGKLQLGRIDAALFSNPYTPRFFAMHTSYSVRLLKLPLPAREVFAAFAKPMSARLLPRYERAAQEAFAGGRFEQYLLRYVERREHPIPIPVPSLLTQ